MTALRLAAALAAAALSATVAPAAADGQQTTTVGFSDELSAYIAVIARPGVASPDVGELVAGATKAECKYDATGTNATGTDEAVAVFVAKVATTATKQSGNVVDGLPAATGVSCELKNDDGSAIWAWEVLRAGSAAYFAQPSRIGRVRRPTICVSAWVLFGDNTRRDIAKHCQPASLL